MAPTTLRVAVIPGDGIGPEVVEATIPVLTDAAAVSGMTLSADWLDWGGGRWLRGAGVMPPDGVDVVRGFDAVLFGAVGDPRVPDHEAVWGLILALRQGLDLYVNLRPIHAYPGVPSPIRDVEGVDFIVVRENSEGEYAGVGGRSHSGTPDELALEVAVHSRRGIERITRVALEIARGRAAERGAPARLSVVTKSNAQRHGYVLWDEVVRGLASGEPGLELELVLVDAMAARIVQRPRSLDTVLASNLFGDILSDLASVVAGGLGMAPSANIRPEGGAPGVFEPVHGSAPDIAGQGVANPLACILSGALLFEHCGARDAAAAVRIAVADTIADPARRTPDLGGSASTRDAAHAVRRALDARNA